MSKSIRVFSGNLWWGKAEPEALVDLIRRNDVDVFCAQELGWANAEAIASELPFGCLEPDDTYQGMGVATRYPVDYAQIPLTFRPARRAVFDPAVWQGLPRTVEIVNIHFQAPHSMEPFPPTRVRAQQAEGLEHFFEANPSDARLLVGDYNATPAWPLYWRMRRAGFADGAAECARREGRRTERTWGPKPESPRLFRIDHALVRGLMLENFRVVEIPGSDHSGLLFDLRPE